MTAVVLFGFSALAVDAAHGFVQKRNSQSTADVSAIGGAFTLLDNTGTDAELEAGLVAEVKKIAAENLGPDLDWDGCTDPDRPGAYATVATDTDCISWSYKWRQVRVRIPERQIPTFFATVIGFDAISVSAFAEVATVLDGGPVLPLGVLSGNTAGLQCGKTGTQTPPECAANSQGNFQYLDFTQYGSVVEGSDEVCNGQTTGRVIYNLAEGVDHLIDLSPGSPTDHQGIVGDDTIFKDRPECTDAKRDAMAVVSQTGMQAQSLSRGLIFSTDPQARLTRGPLIDTISYDGVPIDDTPIQDWMKQEVLDACATINLGSLDPADPTYPQAVLDAVVDTEEEALACIKAVDEEPVEFVGVPGLPAIFIEEIGGSPRLAVVPELHQTMWPNGGKYVTFKSLVIVYIQSMYGGCNGSGGCKTVVTPGENFQIANGNKPSIEAMTVIALQYDTIPTVVRDRLISPEPEAYVLIR